MIVLGALAVLAIGVLLWLTHAAATAPFGWEDDAGWHPGVRPDQDDDDITGAGA